MTSLVAGWMRITPPAELVTHGTRIGCRLQRHSGTDPKPVVAMVHGPRFY